MFCRIYAFLQKYSTLYKLQFGFRKGVSINHALVSLIEAIKRYLNNGKFACGIFVEGIRYSGSSNSYI